MLKPSEIAKMRDEDLSEVPRDVLEFNYRQLAKGALAWIECIEEQHRNDMQMMVDLVGVGQHVAVLISAAQRQGKKTVRIADVLGEAHRKMLEEGTPNA